MLLTLLFATTFHITNKHAHVYYKSSSASVLVLLTSTKTIKIVFVKLNTAEIKYTVKTYTDIRKILPRYLLKATTIYVV